MRKIAFFLAFLFIPAFLFAEENYTVVGKVVDAESKAALPGASIQIIGTSNGTYTNSFGRFRLPFLKGQQKLKVSSISYESKEISVSPSQSDTLVISLKPSSLMLKGVQVLGEIEPNEIIKRAIERKQDNLSKIKTFTGKLYSKLSMEFGGNADASASSDGKGLSLAVGLGGDGGDEEKTFILETFSDVTQDLVKNKTLYNITERRQTANMLPEANVLALGNFINFYDEELEIFSAKISTPLCKKALSYYDFKLVEKTIFDDKFVYVLEFEPRTRLYPLFKGTIKIIEGTYNMIEIDLSPTAEAGITFFQSLNFSQKFSEVEKDIWHPTYLGVIAKVSVDVIKPIIELKFLVNVQSVYNNVQVNMELPPSFYVDSFQGKQTNFLEDLEAGNVERLGDIKIDTIVSEDRSFMLTVSKMADSTSKEFWEKNSFAELSERERIAYKKIDSIFADVDLSKLPFGKKKSNISIFEPYSDFNRVASINLGLAPKLNIWKFELDNLAYYSFGQKKFFGSTELNFAALKTKNAKISLSSKLFSIIEPIGSFTESSIALNSSSAITLHIDNYDYFKKDGWSAKLESSIFNLINISGIYEEARHFSLEKTTNRSTFSSATWRDNPSIEEGNYKNVFLDLSLGKIRDDILDSKFSYEVKLSGVLGKYINGKQNYKGFEGSVELSIPIIPTGYQDISLALFAKGGRGDESLPFEYQYKLQNKSIFLNPMGYFYSAPICHFGGNEYYLGQINLNLTDIWWRALWLPLYEGRGPDLILKAISGKFENNTEKGIYKSTNGEFYSEIGFALRRIPTFISNIFYLGADFHWGLGPIAARRFGWNLTASFPF